MKLTQLEDLLSSACNTFGCLIRAMEAVDKVKVSDRVHRHLPRVPATTDAVNGQLKESILETVRAVHSLSDAWAEHFSLIRGAEARLEFTDDWVNGSFQGLVPSHSSGFMVVLLSSASSSRNLSESGPHGAQLIVDLRRFGNEMPKFPLELMHGVIPAPEGCTAVRIPTHIARRTCMTIRHV